MSDLAPFVAAVIRDRTVEELQEELKTKTKQLQDELVLRDSQLIRITGPNNFPLYAYRPLECVEEEDDGTFFVHLFNSTHVSRAIKADTNLPMCPIQDVTKCELHIGTKEKYLLSEKDYIDCCGTEGDPERAFVYHFGSEHEALYDMNLLVVFGNDPDPDSDGELKYPEDYRNEDISYVQFRALWMRHDPLR